MERADRGVPESDREELREGEKKAQHALKRGKKRISECSNIKRQSLNHKVAEELLTLNRDKLDNCCQNERESEMMDCGEG